VFPDVGNARDAGHFVDDAYLVGRCRGYKLGRDTGGKTPLVATVETDDERRPQRMDFYKVRGLRS